MLLFLECISFHSINARSNFQINPKVQKQVVDTTYYRQIESLFNSTKDNNFEKAIKIGNKTIHLAQKSNNLPMLVDWYNKMSKLYTEYELYSLALHYLNQAIKVQQKLGVKTSWYILEVGNIYYAEELYDDALRYYHNSLNLFKNIKNKNDLVGLSVIYLNLGLTHWKVKNIDSSKYYMHKSISISKKQNDYLRTSNACLHMANVFLSIDNYDSVEFYLAEAENFNRISTGNDLLHVIKEKKGDLYLKLGMYDKAISFYDSGISIAETFNYRRDLMRIHDKKAKIYTLLHEIDKGIEEYKKCLFYAQKINNIRYAVKINKLISESYFYNLDIDSAYHFLWQYANWKDSLDKLNMQVVTHNFEKENELQKLEELEGKLKLEKEGSVLYKYLIFSILTIFIIVVILLYYIIKSRKKLEIQHSKILEQNTTISSQYEEIIQQNELLNIYKNDLEALVTEKTKKLEKALKKAKESDILKTAFLTNLSHEIRTPLNAVMGFGSLLSNTSLDENSRIKYTEILLKSTEELHKVISNMIELSKIESGQIKVNKTYFDVNILFQELMLFFSKQLFERNKSNIKIEFTNQLPNSIDTIVADRNIIKQVMLNLIDNAIKFTQTGGIIYGCKYSIDNSIEFFVKDTGRGIDEKHFETIFKSFQQVTEEDKLKNKGIGLGLSISKSLIDKINGELFVESKKGKGSVFYFTIPNEIPPKEQLI